MDITELLSFGVENKASDLHLSAGVAPIVRVDGDMRKINIPPFDNGQVQALIFAIMNDTQRKEYEEFLEADFSFEIPKLGRFRVNVFQQARGIAAVFRTIPMLIPTLADIGAPPLFKEITTYRKGLVLFTGPTGSGKSTTLAAIINEINETNGQHILTIEDPIEFIHEQKKCLINQREVHRDTRSFATALRSALREDPDVILVGELRDQETISLALTAAETGHLVFGTLHTNSAAKTIDRIIDVFPGAEKNMVRTMLSESLRVVVSQQLMKCTKGGRLAAHEVMVTTPAIRNLIREDKVPQIASMLQTGSASGMRTMEQAIKALLQERLITPEEAEKYLDNKSASTFGV